MALVPLKCPNCAGDIQIDDTKEFAFCMFCGTKMVVADQLKQRVVLDDSAKIEALLRSARDFFSNGAYSDSYKFVCKICEMRDDVAEAWLIRAKTSMSPSEKRSCLLKAKSNASGPLLEDIENEMGTVMFYSAAVFNMSNPLAMGHLVVDGVDLPASSVVVVIKKGHHNITTVPSQGKFSKDFTDDFGINNEMKTGFFGSKMQLSIGAFPGTIAPIGVSLVRLV